MPEIVELRNCAPFNQLPQESFAAILAASSVKKFPAHYHIFNQNDRFLDVLFVIKEGLVEITLLTPGGEEIVVDYRDEGMAFGWTPLFTDEKYTGGARTVKPTECYIIPKQIILETAQSIPTFKDFFDKMVVKRVRDMYANIVSEHGQKALTKMESYPFEKRLSEIMTSPVASCNAHTTAREIAEIMSQKQIRSVVVLNDEKTMIGLVTCRDIIGKVVAVAGANAEELTAEQLMNHNPETMPPQTFMYEAMAYMVRRHLKYLPIIDADEVVGLVSISDLMRYRSQKAMLMIGSIDDANSLDELAKIHSSLLRVANSLLSESRSAPEVMEILSYIHHAIIKRTYAICWQQMLDEGHVAPTLRYCFFLMGSGGRREMQLGPDQDNGFIFEDFPDEQQPEVDAFFIPFADKLTYALDFVGYPLCEGDVMVSNEAWRGRSSDWRQRVADWAANPEPFKVRYSSIFFDFTPLVGDSALAHQLQSDVFTAVRAYPSFLYNVMKLNLTHKVPTGLWTKFVTEKSGENQGKLSLKKGGLVYIVDCIRMFALEHEIRSLTTLERLKQLTRENVFSPETAEHIRIAFEALCFLRMRNEINLLKNNEPTSSYINPDTLSKTEKELLLSSFQAVSKLQSETRSHFGKGLG